MRAHAAAGAVVAVIALMMLAVILPFVALAYWLLPDGLVTSVITVGSIVAIAFWWVAVIVRWRRRRRPKPDVTNVVQIRLTNPKPMVSSVYPHPLVTLDLDEDGFLVGVIVVGADLQVEEH